jgi:hypothetical protein
LPEILRKKGEIKCQVAIKQALKGKAQEQVEV